MGRPLSRQSQAGIALVTFFLAIVSRELFRHAPDSVATLLWKAFWVFLCFLGVFVVHRMSPLAALDELGLRGGAGTGTSVALLASLPMLLTFVFTAKVNPHFALRATFMTSIVSPLTEEMLFRGYLFRQLYRRAGWGFYSAVGVTGGLFGLAHLGSLVGKISAWEVAAEIAIIAVGGAFYAWLFIKWDDNLWVPLALHSFMNLWCIVFACDEAIGNWRNNFGRALTVVLAIVLTRLRNRGTLAGTEQGTSGKPQS